MKKVKEPSLCSVIKSQEAVRAQKKFKGETLDLV